MVVLSRQPSAFGLLVLALAGGSALVGCQTQNPALQRSQAAADLLIDTRQSLVVGEQTVADSQTALQTLSQAKGDLRPSFAVFTTQLGAVRKQAERIARDSGTVRTEGTTYCTARKNDVSTISNDEMRDAAEQRTQRMRAECDTINDMYAQVNHNFATYVRDLTDLQTYLASELNNGTLDSGQRWFDQAIKSGEMLRSNIRALALQVDLTSNILSPVPLATAGWTNKVQAPDMVADRR